MCGLCAPHCPTYRLRGSELESPRGRLSLMSGLWQGRLQVTPAVEEHLESCLLCRNCEAVCPSQVPFGHIMDATRERLAQQPTRAPLGKLARFAMSLLSHPARLRAATWLGWLYQVSGTQRLLRALNLPRQPTLRRLERLLQSQIRPRRLPSRYPTRSAHPARGQVSLFTGCLAPALDRSTVDAITAVLNAAGYEVHIPRDQACCGALHLHNGDKATAQALAQLNTNAFRSDIPHPVISFVTGCAAALREYPSSLGATGFPPVYEICEFLARQAGAFEPLRFAPLRQRVLLHTPCSLRNVLRGERHVRTLLDAIPQLEVFEMPNVGCCGAAGSYMLAQPAAADALRTPLIDAVEKQAVTYLVTTNIGCALHLVAGLRERGLSVEVIHPVTLLARQLQRA